MRGGGGTYEGVRQAQMPAARVRAAIEDGRLGLHAQPIVGLRDFEVRGHELLLRIGEFDRPTVAAVEFIEAAEAEGFITELDLWVAARAIELAAGDLAAGGDHQVHLNLSGATIVDIDALHAIERLLDEGDADPALLTFEVTETAAVTDFTTAAHVIDRLCEFGCRVALDDYGAGWGPFQYLRRLPFDVIKIDGSVVRDLPRNDADRLTVKAVVQVAKGLGKETIAEHVEDEETVELLRSYGVDMAQGHHLGGPKALQPRFLAAQGSAGTLTPGPAAPLA